MMELRKAIRGRCFILGYYLVNKGVGRGDSCRGARGWAKNKNKEYPNARLGGRVLPPALVVAIKIFLHAWAPL